MYLVQSTWYNVLGTMYLVQCTWYNVLGTVQRYQRRRVASGVGVACVYSPPSVPSSAIVRRVLVAVSTR